MASLALPPLAVSAHGSGREVGTNYRDSAQRQIRLYMFLSLSLVPLFVDYKLALSGQVENHSAYESQSFRNFVNILFFTVYRTPLLAAVPVATLL